MSRIFTRALLAGTVVVLSALMGGAVNAADSSLQNLTAAQSAPKRDGEWAFPRKDVLNSAHQPLSGAIRKPRVATRTYLGGHTDFVSDLDTDGDGQTELLTVEAGDLIARTPELSTKWAFRGSGIVDVLGLHDLDGDGTKEVVAHSFYTLYILSGEDGTPIWEKTFTGAITHVRIRVGQLDASLSGKQIVVWPDRAASASAYAFDEGVGAGYELWTSAPPNRDAGDGYLPEVVIDDVNADGDNEVVAAVYGGVIAYDGATGQEITDENGWKGRVDWISGPGINGRNYGFFTTANMDDDPYKEAVVIADGVNLHIAVLENDASGFSLAYDKFVEFPENRKLIRPTINSVGDVDGDGRVEIVVNIFNDSGDERWHLLVIDAISGFDQPEADLVDAYLWGVQDLDGDGTSELLVSRETGKAPAQFGTVEVLGLENDTYQSLWTLDAARFVIDKHVDAGPLVSTYARTDRQEVLRGDISGDGVQEFFVETRNGLDGYQYDSGSVNRVWQRSPASSLLKAGDFNGDGAGEAVLQESDGTLRIEGADGSVQGEAKLGGLESAPTVADLDGDKRPEVVVPAFGSVRVFDVGRSGLVERWRQPGWGLRQANLNFPQWTSRSGPIFAVPIFDLDGDGKKELLLADDNPSGDHTRARLLDGSGAEIWSHTFEDLPSTGFWSGIFTWSVGNFNGDDVLDVYVAAFTGGYNSDVSRILDGRTGALLWSRNQNPDNDGIGFGPSGYPAVFDVDEDGLDDVLILAKDKLWSIDGVQDSVRKLTGHQGLYHSPTVTDVDDDGTSEMVFGAGHIGLDGVTFDGASLWYKDTRDWEFLGRHSGIADVDGDGVQEVGSLQADGLFISLNAVTGEEEWRYQLPSAGSSVVTTDIDDKGNADYVFGTNDGQLIALNGSSDAKRRVIWRLNLGAQIGELAIADVDQDGSSEIVAAAGDGHLYVIDKGKLHPTK